MKFLPLLLILCFSYLSYGMGSKQPPVVELPPITVARDEYVTIRKCTNCTPAQWKFIQEAEVKTNETTKSTCFKSFMLQRKLIDTMSLTPEQVVDRLSTMNTITDVEMYYSLKRVLGYTYGNQPEGKYKIWINRKYMMSWNKCDLGSLLGHEVAHKKGFTHDFNYSPPRDYSVPYSINAAFDHCCAR